jgi:hypothetical protein
MRLDRIRECNFGELTPLIREVEGSLGAHPTSVFGANGATAYGAGAGVRFRRSAGIRAQRHERLKCADSGRSPDPPTDGSSRP